MNRATSESITEAAREAFRASMEASGDAGLADAVTRETIADLVGGRTGFFDSETLTWTFDLEPSTRKFETGDDVETTLFQDANGPARGRVIGFEETTQQVEIRWDESGRVGLVDEALLVKI